eukprot:TRINITY_DN26653_c0_g1_i6.p1 TRINITY_DN26653_c0_g1~~TRINITY_DN26653_c0_g1_i6.p1  ORF type:complete len:344 (+),score=91.68 TRINITY_DN26653_c0_g1_i6:228-1259(+)
MLQIVEGESVHPIARATCMYASQQLAGQQLFPGAAAEAVVQHGGRGIACTVACHNVLVGNQQLMEEGGVEVAAHVQKLIQKLQAAQQSILILAVGGSVVAVLALSDAIREEASEVLSALSRSGVQVHMATGDSLPFAHAVAEIMGIERQHVHAHLLPQHKAELVKQLQREGRTVAFVGDGVNDSLALVQADLGVAIGAGMDIAIEAADVVLVHSSLSDLLLMFSLATYAFQRIRWNFVWAMGYNVLCIPLAAGVFYPYFEIRLPPAVAGLAMGLSSVCVVLSSLSISLFEPPATCSHNSSPEMINQAGLCQRLLHKCCLGQGAAYSRIPSESTSTQLNILTTD